MSLIFFCLIVFRMVQSLPVRSTPAGVRRHDDHLSNWSGSGTGITAAASDIQPKVVININNLYYIPNAQVVNVSPPNTEQFKLSPKREGERFQDHKREPGAEMVPGLGANSWLHHMHLPRLEHPVVPSYDDLVQMSTDLWNQRKDQGEMNLEASPELNVFIDGKLMNSDKKGEGSCKEEALKRYFAEEMGEIFKDSHGIVEKAPASCFLEKDSPCKSDIVKFKDGIELSFEEFSNVFLEMEERPNLIKIIVPGGVSGPMCGYFDKVSQSDHEQAIEHGVCLLDNGYLVPVKVMCRIVALHKWLWNLDPEKSNSTSTKTADVKRIHSVLNWMTAVKCSEWELIVCFIKSEKVLVMFPGKKYVPFAHLEQQEHAIPKGLLNECFVEILRFRIPYPSFRDSLYKLCVTTIPAAGGCACLNKF